MKEYVCGFLFSPDYSKVVLIKKNRPAWQAGMFNGVGGKIEEGETALEAMTREFQEECGLYYYNWNQFCCIVGEDWKVWFFEGSVDYYKGVKSNTDETIYIFDTNNLPDHPEYKVIDNLKWLIPMAMDNCHVFAEATARN
jgi:8-oxo-dGTP diphosphatase